MAIDLRDITDAVQTYLNKKVTIAITDLTTTDGEGDEVNPGETFKVVLEATNADATSGGVALSNLKYRVSVDDGSVAKLVAPGNLIFRTTDLDGNVLAEGTERASLIIENVAATKLGAGVSSKLTVTGKASNAANGGKTSISARVLADVDLDELFPQGEDTPAAKTTLTVHG
jgi:hypothetical protein